jgi:hypothetical protein
LGTFDVHSLAQLSTACQGAVHGVVAPDKALGLEAGCVLPIGLFAPIYSFDHEEIINCPPLKHHSNVKVRTHVFEPVASFASCELGKYISSEVAATSTCVLSESQMTAATSDGCDLICIVGATSVNHDTFLLVARLLPGSSLLGNIDFDPDILFQSVKAKLPRNGFEVRRTGGFSGLPCYDRNLFNFLHHHGSTCREGIATIFLIQKNQRNWDFLYKSAYKNEFVKAHYSPPVLGGQVNPRRIDWTKISGFQYAYAHMKTLLPYIFHQMNQSGPGIRFAFSTSALKEEWCTIYTSWVESSKDGNQFVDKIVCKHTITLLLDSVQYHRDVPRSKVEKDDGNFSFLEDKFC